MPDILIRGMEMPQNCFECALFSNCDSCEGYECYCGAIGAIGYCEAVPKDSRREDCPLVELPEHGDLIDRDEAVSVLKSIGSRDYRREKGTICDAIKMISHDQYVPAVVPAERSGDDA